MQDKASFCCSYFRYAYTDTHTNTQTHTHARTHARKQTNILTHTHTHTHTYSERPEPYAITFITYVSTLKLKHNSWILTTIPTCWILGLTCSHFFPARLLLLIVEPSCFLLQLKHKNARLFAKHISRVFLETWVNSVLGALHTRHNNCFNLSCLISLCFWFCERTTGCGSSGGEARRSKGSVVLIYFAPGCFSVSPQHLWHKRPRFPFKAFFI